MIALNELLDNLRVKEQKTALSSLVVHALCRLKQPTQQLWAELSKLILVWVFKKFKDLFNFGNKNDLLCWACYRPEFEETSNQVIAEVCLLFKVVLYADLQLGVERLQCLYLVQRDQHSPEEVLVLLLQRDR